MQMLLRTGGKAFVAAGAPPEQLERVRTTVARLQPAAAQAVPAAFRTEMAAAVEGAVETLLSRLEEEESARPRGPGPRPPRRRPLPPAR